MRPIVFAVALVVLTDGAPARAQVRAERRAGELDQLLAREARLVWMIELARLQSPALHAAHAEARAASEQRAAASGFPDPELKYEQWAVPLSRPHALGRADTLMFGVRQAIPAPGLVRDRARLAEHDAQIAAQAGRDLQRELQFRLHGAYFGYYASEHTLAVQLEHVGLLAQMERQLRAEYEIGRGDQQGLLRLTAELSRLHNDVADVRQQRASSRLLLNALMSRAPEAALGPAVEISPPPAPAVEGLAAALERTRPDLAAARARVERARRSLELAAHQARRPSFMVGADYWYMPVHEIAHAYGAMLSMTLPWLNPRHRAEQRAAEQRLLAERHKLKAATDRAGYELHDAAEKLTAATEALGILERELVPQAERSLEAARASFAIGRTTLLALLDSLRSYFEVRGQHSRAKARALSALAELEFAAGSALDTARAGARASP